VYAQAEQPGKDLAEYRYRLNRARRRAGRERLTELVALLDSPSTEEGDPAHSRA
jgi:hypothetical protein